MFSGHRTRSHESGGRLYWLPIIFFSYFPICFTPSSSVAIRLCVRAARKLVQYWSHSAEQFNWIFLRSSFADTHIRLGSLSSSTSVVAKQATSAATSSQPDPKVNGIDLLTWRLSFCGWKEMASFFAASINSPIPILSFSHFSSYTDRSRAAEQWGECSAARFCGVRVRFKNEK